MTTADRAKIGYYLWGVNKTLRYGLRLLGLGLFLLTLTATLSPTVREEPRDLSLLVRQLGHDYLLAVGDSSSTIPPVRKVDENTYALSLPEPVVYDRLAAVAPNSLRRADLRRHEISLVNTIDRSVLVGATF